jgi:hypothetical protein
VDCDVEAAADDADQSSSGCGNPCTIDCDASLHVQGITVAARPSGPALSLSSSAITLAEYRSQLGTPSTAIRQAMNIANVRPDDPNLI